MVQTFFSLSADGAQEAWRKIRSIRADRPEHLSASLTGHRLEVFHVALEQSQQQFQAAAAIGYESRPLNLFYGLAQAGRALAAASSLLGNKGSDDLEVWLPMGGHGLSFRPEVPQGTSLLGLPIAIQPNKSDAFSRLSLALQSPLDIEEVAFGALLAQVPEIFLEFGRFDLGPIPLLPSGLLSVDLAFFPTQLMLHAPGLETDSNLTLSAARAWMDRYPALRPLSPADDGLNRLRRANQPGYLLVTIEALDQLRLLGDEWLPVGTTRYRNSSLILPTVGSSSQSLKPLALWWLLLYALSMLARYSPRDWSALMSLRKSPIASMIEHLLDVAIDAVPNLVAEALGEPVEP